MKDNKGNIVDLLPDQVIDELPAYAEKTLHINFNATSAPGNYTITLITSSGAAFISPSFTIP